jgi:hypothetical protein
VAGTKKEELSTDQVLRAAHVDLDVVARRLEPVHVVNLHEQVAIAFRTVSRVVNS